MKKLLIVLSILTAVGLGRACSPSAPGECSNAYPDEGREPSLRAGQELATATKWQTFSGRNETVVLLHGLARTERSMNKMARVLRADGYRVINHSYPSTKATVDELSKKVFKALEPELNTTNRVHFVTHSLGGIVLRNHLETNVIKNLGRVVMLAPPSQGSEVTDKLGNLKPYQWINGPAGNQLGTGAGSVPLSLKAPKFELGIIAGDRSINPILSLLIPGPDDGKVAVARVKPEACTDYLLLHVTHACTMRNTKVINQTRHFLQHGKFE